MSVWYIVVGIVGIYVTVVGVMLLVGYIYVKREDRKKS